MQCVILALTLHTNIRMKLDESDIKKPEKLHNKLCNITFENFITVDQQILLLITFARLILI